MAWPPAASVPTGRSNRLAYLYPGWFASVMGLSGLSLAWQAATPLMGPSAQAAAAALGVLAALALALLTAASLWRLRQVPQAWSADLQHPVRHTFVATLPVAALLAATAGVALLGPVAPLEALWWLGSVGQLVVALWMVSRWWRGRDAGGLQWASMTPALFIPFVGNALSPIAGVPLGHELWSAAQFGVGLLFWPLSLALVFSRVALQGLWPERLRPTVFIFVAPPAAVALGGLSLGLPVTVAWMLWGMAAFSLLWAASQARLIAALPFGLPHWGMSFPLTALATLTLRLSPGVPALQVLGPALLALASLVIAALTLATWRGLRDGSLLQPEPVAALQPAAPSGPAQA